MFDVTIISSTILKWFRFNININQNASRNQRYDGWDLSSQTHSQLHHSAFGILNTYSAFGCSFEHSHFSHNYTSETQIEYNYPTYQYALDSRYLRFETDISFNLLTNQLSDQL